jgi:hypothetical protein
MKKSTKPTRAQINAARARAKQEYNRFLALSDAQKTQEAESAARAKSKPLSPAERAMFDEAGIGRRGRPIRGAGARQISVTMERGLLSRVDQYAHQRGLTRAQLIARSLELAMAS